MRLPCLKYFKDPMPSYLAIICIFSILMSIFFYIGGVTESKNLIDFFIRLALPPYSILAFIFNF
jgi:hypothetical protein